MSTSSQPDGSVARDKQPGNSLLALPAFKSIRTDSGDSLSRSNADASSSHSERSYNEGHTQSLGQAPAIPDDLNGDGDSSRKQKAKEKDKENETRLPTIRSSGGFLLESVSNARRLSRNSLASSRTEPGIKRRNETSELSIPKKRQITDGNNAPPFRSSPLAGEVKRDYSEGDPITPTHSIQTTDLRRSMSSSYRGTRRDPGSASSSHKNDPHPSPPVTVGRRDDPAQIVNMALTLSEGRRRLASGRRYASNDTGERRITSTGTTNSNGGGTLRKRSLAPFLAANRQSSRNRSPKPSFTPSYVDPSQASAVQSTDDHSTPPVDREDEDVVMTDEVSAATLSRVEKAKLYFELAHEHRRLLPHLPPIRRPTTHVTSPRPELMQKAYNPLQYVRNRKLRVWEKTPIHSEADGWYDITKVRSWVDSVISSNGKTKHEADECVRLPPLDQQAELSEGDDPDDTPDDVKKSASPRLPDHIQPKPSRPRSDWVTHPADLLADAYWLEQGLNKLKIQDRDNNVIYPPNTHFQFSGWRNKTPVDVPGTLQEPSPPPSIHQDIAEQPPSALPELPTFKSAHDFKKSSAHGRRKSKFKDSLLVKDASSSRERSRIRRRLFRESSESDLSDSSVSSTGEVLAPERGRRRLRRKRRRSYENGSLSPTAKASAARDQEEGLNTSAHSHGSEPSSTPHSNRSSVDHTALNKNLLRESLKRISPMPRSRTRASSARPNSKTMVTRSSLENERPPRPSTEYDETTAPSSPAVIEWPSIAINLSPPPSRGPSPTRKQRASLLNPFQRKHKDHDNVGVTDFAQPAAQIQQEPEKHSDPPSLDSRGTSPGSRAMSPFSKTRVLGSEDDSSHTVDDHRMSTVSRVSTRSALHAASGPEHSKLRGIFKGGRIAELVGNEVSKVGDYIWKRDIPYAYKHKASASDASLHSHPGSEPEADAHRNGSLLKTPPPVAGRSRSSTVSSTKSEHLSPPGTKISPSTADRPKYNNPNLPSFTSPFQKDREIQEKKQALLTPGSTFRTDSTDQISGLGGNEGRPSNSPRLRMGLPRLDTTAGDTPPDPNRRKSYGFGQALDLTRPREASDFLNHAIAPVTGLAPLNPAKSTSELGQGDQHDQDTNEPGPVSWRDIGRAEALLYSQTVKAREIGFKAEDPDTHTPKFLLDSFTPENRTLHAKEPFRVKRREQHIVAAKNIMETLDKYTSTINYKLHSFSAVIAPSLHQQLQMLEDKVENTLTPQVRGTTDATGELSIKLTTASTLAVKGLNDSIEAAFRRRKRGVRIVRRIWFATIEYIVVGLLWAIWAVVSLVQLFLGTWRTVARVVKWLLWID